jgi:uncharacterized membrane protein
MKTIEKSIDVDCPVSTCYNQWTQFESFPQFMEGVTSVEQMDDKRLRWVAEIGGETKTWVAEINKQEPDRKISWLGVAGAKNGGTVLFEAIEPNRTKLTLQLHYEPEGTKEELGAALGIVSARVSGDLKRFKEFIESRGMETGAWRGEIHGEVVEPKAESEMAD